MGTTRDITWLASFLKPWTDSPGIALMLTSRGGHSISAASLVTVAEAEAVNWLRDARNDAVHERLQVMITWWAVLFLHA